MGINLAHAYSVIDTLVLRNATVKNITGNITDRLIYIRNPWAEDSFNGTYSKSADFTPFQLT